MKRMPVVLVLSLGILMSACGFAQSIGPDGRVLPITSGGTAAPASIAATSATVANPAAPPTVTMPTTNSPAAGALTCPAAIGAYYLQKNDWVSMDPSHSIGFKTTNIAGAAFSYGAAKARVKAQFRDAHSPYQLKSSTFAMCLVGITE